MVTDRAHLSSRRRRAVTVLGTGLLLTALGATPAAASDPIITNQYTADPSVRLFDGKVYLYPSHDRDDATWWDMEDWHAFSSTTLTDWTDHGTVLSVDGVGQPWAKSKAWAPDAAYRNGRYYFYFPVRSEESQGDTDRIGVASATSPSGPFTANAAPLVSGYPQAFDPTVFTDSDGTAYLISGQRTSSSPNPWIARLNADMTTLATQPQQMSFTGASNFFEGAWLHKYNNRYYLSYAQDGSRIGYAVADSISGPYTYQSVILSDIPFAANTTHGSVLPINGEWMMFYHNSQRSQQANASNTNYKRSVVVDKLYYNNDGTIQKIDPTSGPVTPITLVQPTSVNDNSTGTGTNQFDYSGGWSSATSADAHNNDNHYTNTPNASYQVRFDGTQIKVHSPRGPINGDVAFSVLDSSGTTVVPETTVSLYSSAATRSDVVFDSHPLPPGRYTLRARATGTGYINADRVEVFGGPANLLSNAGFENGSLAPWSVETDAARAGRETTYPQQGGWNGYLRPTATQSVALVQSFTAPAGRRYTLTAQVAGNVPAVLGVDVAGAAQGGQRTTSSDRSYATYTVKFTAAQGQAVKVWLYAGTTSTSSAWAVIDNVVVN